MSPIRTEADVRQFMDSVVVYQGGQNDYFDKEGKEIKDVAPFSSITFAVILKRSTWVMILDFEFPDCKNFYNSHKISEKDDEKYLEKYPIKMRAALPVEVAKLRQDAFLDKVTSDNGQYTFTDTYAAKKLNWENLENFAQKYFETRFAKHKVFYLGHQDSNSIIKNLPKELVNMILDLEFKV